MTKRVGVLGGIGPEATSEFYSKLIDRLQKRGYVKSNADFPHLFINSVPAPELIRDEISNDDLAMYCDGVKELDKIGVDFIVMVCNTIHLFREELQSLVSTPIVDLKSFLKEQLDGKKIKSTLIIGTPQTVRKGLYAFDDVVGFVPSDSELKMLSDAVFNFNMACDKDEQTRVVKSICEKYLADGASTVILGCTELALMLDNTNIPTINTVDVLVEAVISKIIK
jgi:aspartate racemase